MSQWHKSKLSEVERISQEREKGTKLRWGKDLVRGGGKRTFKEMMFK